MLRRILGFKKAKKEDWKEDNMYLVVGLGNPGSEYNMTRHNIGFETVEHLASQNGVKINKIKFKGVYGECNIAGEKVLMLKPQTYMNLSGDSVREVCNFYKIPPKNVIVICDDIALEAGKLRIRAKGGAGGHNGLKSIIYNLTSEEFIRIRMGVGAPETDKWDLADFVLSKFTKKDIPLMETAISRAISAVSDIVRNDVDFAMNKYNGMK